MKLGYQNETARGRNVDISTGCVGRPSEREGKSEALIILQRLSAGCSIR
jgi:hypothetical protein